MDTAQAANRKRPTRFQTWVWWLSVVYLVGVLALFFVERFVAERSWWTLLVTYVSQRPLVYPLLLLLVLALASRAWRAVAVNALALLLFLYAFAGVVFPHLPRTVPPGPRVRVMTLNADYFHLLESEQLASLAADYQLDVICLQEASPLRYGNRASEVLRRLPGWGMVGRGQLAVFTRDPVRGWQYRPYPGVPWGRWR